MVIEFERFCISLDWIIQKKAAREPPSTLESVCRSYRHLKRSIPTSRRQGVVSRDPVLLRVGAGLLCRYSV